MWLWLLSGLRVGTFAQDNTADPVAGESFTYPEDTWFLVSHVIDMDTNTVSFSIDGTEFYNGDFFAETGNVAGVDFFSISLALRSRVFLA